MNFLNLSRREFVSSITVFALLGLSGCATYKRKFVLAGSKESLPRQWLEKLHSSWTFKHFETQLETKRYPYFSQRDRTDLFVVDDGWIGDLPLGDLLPMEANNLIQHLNAKAKGFLMNFEENDREKFLPIGFSPWVMLYRNGEPWLNTARNSWEVLLEPELKGQVVLPDSPRMLISLVDKIGRPDKLRDLRLQARAFDDRNALNWLKSGKARVAVLPLHRCIKTLVHDPRLQVILPVQGGPLNWTFLVRPSSSRSNISQDWIEDSWKLPLLPNLLAQGWIPPLSYSELAIGKRYLSRKLQSVLLPPQNVWDKCWSLDPLDDFEKSLFERRWKESLP